MTPALYFLRSSESKIVKDMMKYAHPKEENTNIYSDFYGLSTKDLGLYALVDNTIAGAIWSRELSFEKKSLAFIDNNTPILSIAVLPELRGQGIGSAMMHQFLLEAGEHYEQLSIGVINDKQTKNFFKKFDFLEVTSSEPSIFSKKLEKKSIIRPKDNYDPQKWMD